MTNDCEKSVPLIVEFPSEPRSSFTSVTDSDNSSKPDELEPEPRRKGFANGKQSQSDVPRRRLVRFSSGVVQMNFFQTGSDQLSKLCYSSDEKKQFEIQASSDARRIVAIMVTRPPEDLSQDILCECVGLEKLMPPSRARRTKEHRRNHAHTVISWQYRCSDDEELRLISQRSSRVARENAEKLASINYKI